MASKTGLIQQTRARFHRETGFSIIELMVVLTILSILSMAAVMGYRRYIMRGKSMEALHMLADIGMKQAMYFSLYGQYIDTNQTGATSHTEAPSAGPPGATAQGFYPASISGGNKDWSISCPVANPNDYPAAGWCALGFRPSSNTVNYQYITVGWAPGESGAPSSHYIADPSRQWWYAIARGDLDNNGLYSTFVFSSEVSAIWSINPNQ